MLKLLEAITSYASNMKPRGACAMPLSSRWRFGLPTDEQCERIRSLDPSQLLSRWCVLTASLALRVSVDFALEQALMLTLHRQSHTTVKAFKDSL